MLTNYNNNPNVNVNFRWSGVTHRAITEAATNAFNGRFYNNTSNVKFDVHTISNICAKLDHERHVPHSHSADIDKFQSGDAFDTFYQYDRQIRKDIKGKKYDGLDNLIGRALHYVQDMATPPHARDYLTDIPSQTDKRIHFQIENDAKSLQNRAIPSAKAKGENTTVNFDTLLKNKMKESKEIREEITELSANPTRENKKKIEKLEIQSLENTYEVTFKYLRELGKLKQANEK